MSLVLRHAPQEANLTLDTGGWASWPEIVVAIQTRFGTSEADIKRIVETSDKKRFTLDGDRIRAAQGHSVVVDLELRPRSPEHDLYHGTTETAWQKIKSEGLKPGQRQQVHLSVDKDTAWKVAKRRKGPHVILSVDCASVERNGGQFFLADNGVWLIDQIAADHLKIIESAA